jgi:hypothetical protein
VRRKDSLLKNASVFDERRKEISTPWRNEDVTTKALRRHEDNKK